ncbi:MAG: deoxyhypusine synthase family protein, partial [Microbacterium sp.]|nr:deoxyhypusine synthase family protein [Microbacterium sp.]
DSSIGMNLAALSLQGGRLQIDTLRDVNETASIVHDAKRSGGKSGVLLLGGQRRVDDVVPGGSASAATFRRR